MHEWIERPQGLITVADQVAVGIDDRSLRLDRAKGELKRLRRGAYVRADELERSDSDGRYDLTIAGVVATRRSMAPLSHLSAARVWKLPIVNSWPREVDFTVDPASPRRTRNGVVIHRHELEDTQFVERDGMLVTSLARTLVDLGRTASFRDAVTATDRALSRSLITKDELRAELEHSGDIPGRHRAERVIDFSSALVTYPGESFSRVLMHELGFPEPVLQREVRVPAGGKRYLDFWWEALRLDGEFDGKTKYTDPEFTRGRTPEEILWDEKLRENELRELGIRTTRWTWQDLVLVTPFIRRLEAAGLRRSAPIHRRSARSGR